MKFPRTIRLDSSDSHAFPRAAASGEWAVTGTFAYSEADPAGLKGKEQLAFRNGWLGTGTFGRSTMVQVAHISDAEIDEVTKRLAAHLIEAYGAPDMEEALPAARFEVADATGLAEHPSGTLLSIEREWTDDGIRERVRVIEAKNKDQHARIWSIEEDEEGEGG